jgi:hypothetical protein|tara:strand:- start:1630 stop:1848 length:219 start_codon:yes stop_codon:yes gene_type:complete
MVQLGDLIRDKNDGDLGLVTSEICSYNTIEGPAGQYVWVKWNIYSKSQRMSMTAIEKGWVEVVSETEETTNR